MDEYIQAVIGAEMRANASGKTHFILKDLSITSDDSERVNAVEIIHPSERKQLYERLGVSELSQQINIH